MSSTKLGRWRGIWFNIHLWIGVILTILLAPLGLTGSLLVWREALSQPAGASGAASLPPSAYLKAGGEALGPDARIVGLRMPAHDGQAVVVQGRLPSPDGEEGGRPRQVLAWIDPSSARVLTSGAPGGGAMGVVHRLHETFLLPGVGRQIVGWCGWAMLVSALTGLWLWWPRIGGFIAGLRWTRTGWQLLNLHHTVGFWLCIPLAVLSLTGVGLAFPDMTGSLVGVFAPEPAGALSGPPGAGAQRGRPGGNGRGHGHHAAALTPDQAAALALAGHPGARLASLSLPAGGSAAWRVQLQPAKGPALDLNIDDATGAVSPAPNLDGPSRAVHRWIHRLHGGEQTGLVWRVVITVAGLAPTLLGVTGILVWLRRRRTKTA